jgi:hypothetical protein
MGLRSRGSYDVEITFPATDASIQEEYRGRTVTVWFDGRKPPMVDDRPLEGGALRYVKNSIIR